MPKIKLTDADVRGLRYARNVEGASLAFLANAYGVSKAQVSRMTRGLQRKFKEIPKLEDFCAARRLLEAKDVPIHPDANYAVMAPEVSSHEETPEVGKLSVSGPPVNRSVTVTVYTDAVPEGADLKEAERKKWFEAWERLMAEPWRARSDKILQEF